MHFRISGGRGEEWLFQCTRGRQNHMSKAILNLKGGMPHPPEHVHACSNNNYQVLILIITILYALQKMLAAQ